MDMKLRSNNSVFTELLDKGYVLFPTAGESSGREGWWKHPYPVGGEQAWNMPNSGWLTRDVQTFNQQYENNMSLQDGRGRLIPCGSVSDEDSLFVLDIDVHDSATNGFDSYRNTVPWKDGKVPTTDMVVKTPSGGEHHYFRVHNSDLADYNGCAANILADKKEGGKTELDVRAGKKAYIIAPGTAGYAPDKGIAGYYEVQGEIKPFKDLPLITDYVDLKNVLKLNTGAIRAKCGEPPAPIISDDVRFPELAPLTPDEYRTVYKFGETLIRNAPYALTGHGRREAAMSMAAKLRWKLALKAEDAWELLTVYNSDKCKPAFPEKKLREKFDSAGKPAVVRPLNSYGSWRALALNDFGGAEFRGDVIEAVLDEQSMAIRLNDMSHTVEITRNGVSEMFEDEDRTLLRNYVVDRHPFVKGSVEKGTITRGIDIKDKTFQFDQIFAYSREHRFHPVLEWLETLKWDGKDRFSELCDIWGLRNECEREMLKYFLRQAIILLWNTREVTNRAGGVLVLQGDQGIGKSTIVRKLFTAGDASFFNGDAGVDPTNKDSVMEVVSAWCTELGELGATTRHADVEALKRFLTRVNDKYRIPYEVTVKDHYRRTVFCATVNDDGFLRDLSGNRRYWIVQPHPDLSRVDGFEYAQLWAQFYEDCKGKGWDYYDLPESIVTYRDAVNEEYRSTVRYEDEALDYFGSFKNPEDKDCLFCFISTADIAKEARFGENPFGKLGGLTQKEISNILKALGCGRATRVRCGKLNPRLYPILLREETYENKAVRELLGKYTDYYDNIIKAMNITDIEYRILRTPADSAAEHCSGYNDSGRVSEAVNNYEYLE